MMSGGGMGGGWWLMMLPLWIVLIAVIVWAATQLLPSRSARSGEPVARETPEHELDMRLVRGEINAQTYDELRQKLRSARGERGAAR